MRVLIFGAGAVGLGLASCLIKSEKTVDLIGREDTVSALQIDGLERIGLFGEYHAEPWAFNAFTDVQEVEQKPYDYILVCTKSFDTQPAAEALASFPELRNDRTQIVLCQNGWGNAEIFATFFPSEQIKNGRVITGFICPQKNKVNITVHADTIHLGSLFGDAIEPLKELADAIDQGGVPCCISTEIEKDLWAKMLYNCMLNGLSTLFGVPYGMLGESEHSRDLMRLLSEEVFAVMEASGHKTHWDSTEAFREVFYQKQLPSTFKHEPSMLQDIRSQKPTEIEALNGQIVTLGIKHKVSTPINLAVYHMIRFLENKMNLPL